MLKRVLYTTLCILALAGLLASGIACDGGVRVLTAQNRLRVATTTSLYDTGLWSYLEPKFEQKYAVQLDVIPVGSGAAFDWGRRGDVDVLTIHSKDDEEKFIADGFGVERVIFAYNHFVIVGPADDPAGIKGLAPEQALRKIFETASTKFVSRGDQSGTHTKEKVIWKAAGYADYANLVQTASWYVNASGGMGQTLEMANELHAYTLSDIGTFLSYKSKLNLVPLVEQGPILLNVYSVIACKNTKMKDMANNMVTFLTSPEIQDLIGQYGVKDYGQQLFTPCAGKPEPAE